MQNYLYKFGNIEVYKKFEEPTYKTFHSWRTEFLNNTNLDNYDISFRGNAAERIFGMSPIPTLDVDIILSGEIDSYENLSNIFNTAFNIGLNYNLCIDIFHIDKNILADKWWGEYNQIRFYDRTQKNGNQTVLIEDKIEDLPYGLYKFKKIQVEGNGYKKLMNRFKSGHYMDLRFDLKTMEIISFN